MFGFKRRRRRKILAEPFPGAWQATLHRNVSLYGLLAADERRRVRDGLRIFMAEKRWEGVKDFDLTDEMKVTIAAHASLLTLGMDGEPLRHVHNIIVQPRAYLTPGARVDDNIAQGRIRAAGTAYLHGPVVLSWDDVLADGRGAGDGRNVALHEFAHKLDMTGGLVDGTPPLGSREQYARWHQVMTDEFDRLNIASQHGMATLLDVYGASEPAEFFAVATECFFECAPRMQDEHSELYDVLREYYGQDPAEREEHGGVA